MTGAAKAGNPRQTITAIASAHRDFDRITQAPCPEPIRPAGSVPHASIEDVERREVAVFEKFQRRPPAGGNVADLVGQSHLLDRGRAVAAADDGRGTVL